MPRSSDDILDQLFGAPKAVPVSVQSEQPGSAPTRSFGTPAPRSIHPSELERADDADAKIDKTSPYFAACPKCRGTGYFYSYAGRLVGPCLACKGTGGQMTKSTNDERAKAAAQRSERAQSTANDHILSFAKAHPDEYVWMASAANRPNPFDFAVSMVEAVRKYGHLTERQLAAMQKCMAKDAERAEAAKARVDNAPVVTVDKLKAAFDHALESGLKKPKLRFEGFQVSMASATGANAGAYYVKDGENYYGKIKDGKFFAVLAMPTDLVESIQKAMIDPVGMAVAYGRRTGHCSCCGRELTDPVSVANGIGPICAAGYGF